MVTFDQISVALEHPLVLLLIGAGVSGVLVSWLTNRWQDHKKKLEIKVDIASKMNEVIGHQIANAVTSISRKKKTLSDAEREALDEDFRKWWYVDINAINTKLGSYFPETDLKNGWESYVSALSSFSNVSRMYFYEDEAQKKSLRKELESINKYFLENTRVRVQKELAGYLNRFMTETTFSEELWQKVAGMFLLQGESIIKDLLKLRIKVF